MRMKHPYHGRSHKPGGSDPVPGAIHFDTDPQAGHFLVVTANGPPADSGYAVDVTVGANQSINFHALGPDGGFSVNAPFYYLEAQEGIMRFTSCSLFDIQADNFQFTGDESFAVTVTEDATIVAGDAVGVTAGGNITVTLATAATSLTVLDHLNNPVFRVEEDGNIHIKTGKTITADL